MNHRTKKASILVAVSLCVGPWVFAEVHPDTQRVSGLLDQLSQSVDLEIEWRAVVGLASPQYQWHIGHSPFWIRLHPQERYDLEQFDRKKRYLIRGVVLEGNYGMVDVWVRHVQEVKTD